MFYNYKNKADIQKAQNFLLANVYDSISDKLSKDLISKHIFKSTKRIIFTLGLLAPLKAGDKILEIGAMPYCFSTLLIELFSVDVTSLHLPNCLFPGEPYNIAKEDIIIPNEITHKKYGITSWTCNAEKDMYPFKNETFDVVICTEVLEHLLYSPTHVFKESYRVLKDKGLMLVSTVNSLHFKRMADIILNNNIDDVFTNLGCYGRHNRNWTRQELIELAENNNFNVSYATSATLRGSRSAYGSFTATTPVVSDKQQKSKFLQKLGKNLRKSFLNLIKLLVHLPLPGMKDKRHYNIFLLLEKKT